MADDATDDEVGAPRPYREGVVVLDGQRSFGYAAYGDPDGVPVLWFHGTPGARKQVPPRIDEEAEARGYRVICLERPGTGLSTPGSYHRIVDYAADVAAVADDLGLDRFGVVGLSGGGPYVLACCHALPDRVIGGAVLGGIGPTRGPETAPGYTKLLPAAELFLRLTGPPLGELVTHALRAGRALGSQAYDIYSRVAPPSDRAAMKLPGMKETFLFDLVTALEGGMRSPFLDLLLFSREWGFSLQDIRVPVRFWHGDADGIVPLSHGQFMSALVPGATLEVCPGGGHFAGFLLGDDVLDWFTEVRKSEGAGTGPSATMPA